TNPTNSTSAATGTDLYAGNLNITQSGNAIGQSLMPNRAVGSISGVAPGSGAAAGGENKTAGLKTMGSKEGSIFGPAPGSGAAGGQENIAGRNNLGRDNAMATAAAAAPLTLDPFERAWRKVLHDGFIPGTASKIKTVALISSNFIGSNLAQQTQTRENKEEDLIEIIFRPDPAIYDGRFANNGWLQELPKPLSKLTWDNAALMSPAMAKKLGVSNEDIVELRYQGRKLTMPVWTLVGHVDDSVTVYLGYGRERAGRVGTGTGFNTYSLRGSEAPNFADGLKISKTGKTYRLATTQHHHTMEGRRIVRSATLQEYLARPDFAQEEFDRPDAPNTSIYQAYEYKDYSWGMVINTNSCVGCNACVIACQAENNIPIVGKEEVIRQRAMHWIRIDRYYHSSEHSSEGDDENDPSPEVYHQPVLCMQCENAPCEVVCPVEATSHDAEGLNNMTYNRCVGTRYCSNNCPYKVRRFNFFQYADYETPSLKLGRNPNVTVRSRGVM
ncbi:MAG: 4Fe-4S dicluster domain-containing protein, partial [Pyrinomonadaceae bacterium]